MDEVSGGYLYRQWRDSVDVVFETTNADERKPSASGYGVRNRVVELD